MPAFYVRPLRPGDFPRPFHVPRKSGPFRASWSDTEDLLYAETKALGALEVVIAVEGLADTDLRLDGSLRANARPSGAAVLVAFDTMKTGPLSFPADRYLHWQDNVRAVALGLEALRKVDRYGITAHAEQYRGWNALPPGRPMPAAMTVDEAERLLLGFNDTNEVLIGAPRDLWRRLYHRGAKRLHPDTGGDPEEFRRLREAYELVSGLTANSG